VTAKSSSRLDRVRRIVARTEDTVLAVLLTGMILLAAAQIISRNLFSYGLIWGEPLLRVMVLWLALLGAMAATRDGNHIQIDVLPRFLPQRLKHYTRRITDLFSALVCALLAWHAARFVHAEWQDGLEMFAGIPSWVFELIIPVGFGIMALRFLLHTVTGPPVRDRP
jgi:TRAP-type C4-dicarboxylate transport system permease small subunit